MPLTAKGKSILEEMIKTYGSEEKAKEVFYASKNAGKITGVDEAIRFYVTEQLSEHIAETPEKYLLCTDVPITRIGEFLYRANDLIGNDGKPIVEATPDGMIRIQRDETDVFNEIALKSFEGKPLTLNHPKGFVGPENWSNLAHGTIQNVHRGIGEQSDLMLADILVTTEEAINLIKSGQRELSCGYDAEYAQIQPGLGKQMDIIGNHVALVAKGRAGDRCKIQDQAPCTGCGKCTCGKNKKTTDSQQEEEDMAEKKVSMAVKVLRFLDSLGVRDADETEEEKAKRLAEEAKANDAEETPEEKAKREKEEAEAKEKETKDAEENRAELKAMIKEILAEIFEEMETEDADETEEEKKVREAAEAKEKEEAEKKTKDAEEAEAKKEEEKEKEKEEKKETEDAWPDFLSHADILVPGVKLVKPTKDHKKTMDSLKAAVLIQSTANEEYGKEVEKIFAGKDPKVMTTDSLDTAILAASVLVGSLRNGKIQKEASQKVLTGDGQAATTAAKINQANKDFHTRK
jgi:uncharacterized protein